MAARLKARIRQDTRLTASAGVAPNKFLAKIASGWKKPDGLTVISPDRVEPFLQKLQVDALWGVGPVTARKLRARGIERLVDVRAASPDVLRDTVGSLADWLRQLADGIDDRPVTPDREVKSSGSENTYAQDVTDLAAIRTDIARMAADAAGWLRAEGAAGAHGHHQSPLRRLHDDYAEPYRSADAGRSRDSSSARCGSSTGPRPARGPSGCWGSASTISATPPPPLRPGGCPSRTIWSSSHLVIWLLISRLNNQ